MDLQALDPSYLSLHSPQGAGPRDHFVELYDEDAALAVSLATFVATGISSGEAAILIATPTHSPLFDLELSTRVDLEAARAQRLYRVFDAETTLASFMVGDLPDAAKFEGTIGPLVEEAISGGRNVRLFGEMVAVLWERGNIGGALALEDLWNDLAEKYPFRLFCAYPAGVFGDKNLAPLKAVCGRHSHVVVTKG
jgi:DcmR-like sensory protein